MIIKIIEIAILVLLNIIPAIALIPGVAEESKMSDKELEEKAKNSHLVALYYNDDVRHGRPHYM